MMRNLAFAGLILALAGCGNDPNRIDPSRFLKLPGKGETAPQATPGQMAQAALQHLQAAPTPLHQLQSPLPPHGLPVVQKLA